MCLRNRLKGKEKEAAIAALPETFFVWKYCPRGREYTQYRTSKKLVTNKGVVEPVLKQNRWYKAQKFSYGRSMLNYDPGFHAFLDYDKAKEWYYCISGDLCLFRFQARKQDVKEIGNFSLDYGGLKGVVLQFIKPAKER